MTTFAKDFTIRLGLAATRGKLLTMTAPAPKAAKMTSLCPVCKDSECNQYLFPKCGHTPADLDATLTEPGFSRDQVVKGQKNIDDKWVEFTPEDAAEVVSDLPTNSMDLNVHPFDQVARAVYPSGVMYWFEPEAKADEFYSLLVQEVGYGDHAFVAVVNFERGGEKLCQLCWHNDGLVVQQLTRPEDLVALQGTPVKVEAEFDNMVQELIHHMSDEFAPAAYANGQGDKIRALLDDKEPIVKPRAAKAGQKHSKLLDELETALAQAKKTKKPVTKKTSRKVG